MSANDWYESAFGDAPAALPFSFIYDGRESAELLPNWQREVVNGRVTYTDPDTHLEVRCEVRRLSDFGAVEWVLHFCNRGDSETPIVSDVQALDTAFALPRDQHCRVNHALGSDCRIDDFAPLTTALNPNPGAPQGRWVGPDAPLVLETTGGRSSEGALPFFGVELGEPGGIVVAVGWTGGWRALIWRGDGGEARVRAGMKHTHFRLHAGEEVRAPRILLLFYTGEPLNGNNMLRRLILDDYAPRREAPISFAVWGENRIARQLAKVRWFREKGIALDNFWIDAGWHGDVEYKDSANVFNSDWGKHVGNWWPNQTAYPNGLSQIGDAVREAGMDFTLWFEPERVWEGTQFTEGHPEWLLGPHGPNHLYYLGIPEAREALTDLVSSVIEEAGVTVYRQDFNMDPAPFWEAADEEDRIGISEIRHIEGLYAFWDALLERHPGLLIDDCSSGGRRIDLEMLSRSIPLWRSDYQCFKDFDPAGMQGQTQGLSLWVPVHAGACDRQDTYALRSALGPGLTIGPQPNESGIPEGFLTPWDAFDADWLRHAVEEERSVRPYFAGDFYPLLSYSLAADAWAAWQFDRPDLGEGLVQAFRRPTSPFAEMSLRLQAIDPQATYQLTDLEGNTPVEMSGADLASGALTIRIDETPGARVLTYRRLECA